MKTKAMELHSRRADLRGHADHGWLKSNHTFSFADYDDPAAIHQDADIDRIRLEPGQSVTHELMAGRGAWLQIADGALMLNGVELLTGDGASTGQPGNLTLTATRPTEASLFDLK